MGGEEEAVYDDIPFAEMQYDEESKSYTHACPCGDMFEITEHELRQGETIAHCNDCSLVIRVVLDGSAKERFGLVQRSAEAQASGTGEEPSASTPPMGLSAEMHSVAGTVAG
jgi:diphthamide biosynthesis protein 3